MPTVVKSHILGHDTTDLRNRAVDVMAAPPVRAGLLSAAEAAQCLIGVMSWVQRTSSLQAMQRAAAQLVRYDAAWSSSFGRLPHEDGLVQVDVALIAVVCRGLLEMAGPKNLRAALAFWATESDPAVWRQLVTPQA